MKHEYTNGEMDKYGPSIINYFHALGAKKMKNLNVSLDLKNKNY
jgi:hypothetical protein